MATNYGSTPYIYGSGEYGNAGTSSRGLSDTLTCSSVAIREYDTSSIITLSALLSFNGIRVRSVSDTVTVTDTVARQFDANLKNDLVVTITSVIAQANKRTRTAADTMYISDAILYGTAKARTSADTVNVTDDAVFDLSRLRDVTDTVSITDRVSAACTFMPVSVADTVTVTDTAAAIVTPVTFLFRGPTYVEKTDTELWFIHHGKGVTVYKDQAGAWHQTIVPVDSDLAAAARVYRGGYTYTITGAEKDDLVAAGYGAYITYPPLYQFGFEESLNGWDGVRCTVSTVTNPHSGLRSLRIDPTVSDDWPYVYSAPFQVVPGSTVMMSLWVAADAAVQGNYLWAGWVDNGPDPYYDYVEQWPTVVDATSGWRQLTFTFTVPGDVTRIRVGIEYYAETPADHIYIDDVVVV